MEFASNSQSLLPLTIFSHEVTPQSFSTAPPVAKHIFKYISLMESIVIQTTTSYSLDPIDLWPNCNKKCILLQSQYSLSSKVQRHFCDSREYLNGNFHIKNKRKLYASNRMAMSTLFHNTILQRRNGAQGGSKCQSNEILKHSRIFFHYLFSGKLQQRTTKLCLEPLTTVLLQNPKVFHIFIEISIIMSVRERSHSLQITLVSVTFLFE